MLQMYLCISLSFHSNLRQVCQRFVLERWRDWQTVDGQLSADDPHLITPDREKAYDSYLQLTQG